MATFGELTRETTADTKAMQVGAAVRDYVRDRFVPGSLAALDDLRDEVAAKVWAAILMDRTERSP